MMHSEQQMGKHEARLDNLERSAATQREEIREDINAINSKLDAIIEWQNRHSHVATLHERVQSLEQSRDKLLGGWGAVAVVASAAAACSGGVVWFLNKYFSGGIKPPQ